ncbi:hypothetical protein N9D23_15815 [Rubripirellula sp.]|nr:hypothetical protein [Rubripirellula sp.]
MNLDFDDLASVGRAKSFNKVPLLIFQREVGRLGRLVSVPAAVLVVTFHRDSAADQRLAILHVQVQQSSKLNPLADLKQTPFRFGELPCVLGSRGFGFHHNGVQHCFQRFIHSV